MYTKSMLLNGEQPIIYLDIIVNGVFSMFYNQKKSGKTHGSVTASSPQDITYLVDFFRSMGFTVDNINKDRINNHFTVSW